MRRNLIKQRTAYTLTIPIKWIRDHKLKETDEIVITEEKDGLLLTTEKQNSPTKEVIELKKGISHSYRIPIENHYLRGTDELYITFEDPKALIIIQEVVSNLIGFEVVEQTKNSCKVSETAEPTLHEFATLTKRLINIIRYSHQIILEDIASKDWTRLPLMEQYIADARRFNLFCRRTIHKKSVVSRTEESFTNLLYERLVLIEYEHYFLYKKMAEVKKPLHIRKEYVELFKRSQEMYLLFADMFAKKKTDKFAQINELWEDVYVHKPQMLYSRLNEAESIILQHTVIAAHFTFLVAQPNTVLVELPM